MSGRRQRQRYKLHGTPQERLEKAFMKAYRAEAVREQNHRCAYCFDPITPSKATADHVKAQSKGGKHGKGNIVASCGLCNSLKGSMDVREFVKIISSFPSGRRLSWQLAWMRRRINRLGMNAERRLYRAFGMEPPT